MEGSEGMVAVVRGLQEAGLAVTLMDGTRHYTLMPNAAHHHSPMPTHVHVTRSSAPARQRAASADVCTQPAVRCDSAAQATDGQYASIYKMTHCKVTPTSPPLQVTEFPPQRAEVCPARGNFEVGGAGSGDTYCPTRISSAFRGGMSWPDRGSVCTPRSSHGPDPFANSLRRYPSMSPERSSEKLERLINYTQAKNVTKRSQTSPTRISETNFSNHLDRSSSKNTTTSRPIHRVCEPEICVKAKARTEESPTRDGRPKRTFECEGLEYRNTVFGRNHDVRHLKDVTKRFRESFRNVSTYPYSQPVCPNIKERYDHLPPEQQLLLDQNRTNSVNMEIQAAVQMISREVATMPKPSRRNVAVPLSPTSSTVDPRAEGELSLTAQSDPPTKSVQTTFSPVDLTYKIRESVQTTSSSIELLNVNDERHYNEHIKRKSKSQEELSVGNANYQDEIVDLLETILFCDNDKMNKMLHDELLKKYNNRNEIKSKVKADIKNIPVCYPDCLYLNRKIRNRTIEVYRAEVNPFRITTEENNLDFVLRDWLKDIQLKRRDFLGRPIDRQQVINTVINRIKHLLLNLEGQCILRCKIIEILEELPIEANGCNKRVYLTGLTNGLLEKIYYREFDEKNNQPTTTTTFKNHRAAHNNIRRTLKLHSTSNFIQPTEDEIKVFIRDELAEFLEKSQLKICAERTEDIELELINLLFYTFKDLPENDFRRVKEEIVALLLEMGKLSEHQAMYFASVLIEHLKEFISVFDESKMTKRIERSQTFVVLQNTTENTSRQNTRNETSDFSISEITERDIEANLERYVSQVTQQIDEWLANVQDIDESDHGFRQVVINDLAGDIVDRHKYLELYPSKRGSNESELEYLKTQIFKWINKLIGYDAIFNALDHASELLERVRSIPRPILTIPYKPGYTLDTSMPPCCVAQSTPKSQSPIPETRQGPSTQRVMSPDRFSSNKLGFDAKQMPTFGPVGQGGSMTEAPRRDLFSDKRMSGPGTLASGPMAQNSGNASLSKMFGAIGPGGSMSEGSERSPLTNRRLSGPGAIASGPMQNGKIESRTPMFGPLGPGGSMSEAPHHKRESRRLSGPARISTEQLKVGGIDINQLPAFEPAGPGGTMSQRSPQPTSSSSHLDNLVAPKAPKPQTSPTVNQLNEEYDEYIKNWLKDIPIPASNAQEQVLADKIRLGIYNGIWKAITKLQLEPAKFYNPFYCQDILDDELEDLFSCLPQTQELVSKKQYLKAKLEEKTTNTLELIISTVAPATYKQQLVENVDNNLPKRTAVDIRGEDHIKLYEDMEKLNLAEDFILYTRYKEEDKVKANVFRKKLGKHIDQLVQNIKRTHGKDLNKLNPEIYFNEVISALHRVPLPSDETLREEADEILLGLEIEQWLLDLPVVQNNDTLEQLHRRRLRDALAKKIHDMKKDLNLDDNLAEKQLKQEMKRFLERLPMQAGENVNLNFMVDEFMNRLKNQTKEQAPSGKSVAFQELGYESFVQNIPLRSSYADLTGEPSEEKSSYMIVGGSRHKDGSYIYGGQHVQMRPNDETSVKEWFTLVDSQAPPPKATPQRPRPAQISEWQELQASQELPPCCQQASGTLASKRQHTIQGSQLRSSVQVKQEPQAPRTDTVPVRGMGIIDANQLAGPSRPQIMQKCISDQAGPAHDSFQGTGPLPRIVGTNVAHGPSRQFHEVIPYTEHDQGSLQARVEAMERHIAGILPGTVIGSPQQHIGSAVQAGNPGIVPVRCSLAGPSEPIIPAPASQEPRIQQEVGGRIGIFGTSQIPGPSGQRPCSSGQPCSPDLPRGPMLPRENVPSADFVSVRPQIQGPRQPTAQHASVIHRSMDQEGLQHVTDHNRPIHVPATTGNMSIYDQQPVGYSTPQPVTSQGTQGAPPRLARKRTREAARPRRDTARRRLELEETEEEVVRERDEVQCRCMERVFRCRRRRPVCYESDEVPIDYPRCCPMRYPYPCFF